MDSRTAATHSRSRARSRVGWCSRSRTWRWIIAAPARLAGVRGLGDLLGRGGQVRAVVLGRLGAGRGHGDQEAGGDAQRAILSERVSTGSTGEVRWFRDGRRTPSSTNGGGRSHGGIGEDACMRAVVQRVSSASVTVDGEVVGALPSPGLLVYLGVTHTDGPAEVDWMARKIWTLRILPDEQSASDVDAPVLVVSQFTLYGDARKGRRPTWEAAAPGSRLRAAVRRRLRRPDRSRRPRRARRVRRPDAGRIGQRRPLHRPPRALSPARPGSSTAHGRPGRVARRRPSRPAAQPPGSTRSNTTVSRSSWSPRTSAHSTT